MMVASGGEVISWIGRDFPRSPSLLKYLCGRKRDHFLLCLLRWYDRSEPFSLLFGNRSLVRLAKHFGRAMSKLLQHVVYAFEFGVVAACERVAHPGRHPFGVSFWPLISSNSTLFLASSKGAKVLNT